MVAPSQRRFAPFVQVGKDRSGFGLGLAIAKQAIEAHQGRILVKNHPGEHCVFALDWPTNTKATAPAAG